MNETVFVTGGAGFIGFHLIRRLIKNKIRVVTMDNLNSYYNINLKKARLTELNNLGGSFNFYLEDIEDISSIKKIFKQYYQ